MSEVHRYVGWAIPIGFTAQFLWALYTYVRKRPPHDWFWNLLGILQAVVGIQVVIGVILLASGLSPDGSDPVWLHYAYGGVFPALVLVVAHRWAHRLKEIPWVVFGFAALVNAGLTARALMTGLGTG